jgi:hypothetical protein
MPQTYLKRRRHNFRIACLLLSVDVAVTTLAVLLGELQMCATYLRRTHFAGLEIEGDRRQRRKADQQKNQPARQVPFAHSQDDNRSVLART